MVSITELVSNQNSNISARSAFRIMKSKPSSKKKIAKASCSVPIGKKKKNKKAVDKRENIKNHSPNDKKKQNSFIEPKASKKSVKVNTKEKKCSKGMEIVPKKNIKIQSRNGKIENGFSDKKDEESENKMVLVSKKSLKRKLIEDAQGGKKVKKSVEASIALERAGKEKRKTTISYHQWVLKIQRAKNSVLIGRKTFEWMIAPTSLNIFLESHWEKKPLLVKRNGNELYEGLLSTSAIDKMLRNHNIQYTKNIDITSYRNGTRETHNLEGRALASSIWDFYNSGCSIRLLNPQTFNKPVWLLLATLQEYFKSFCGANVYLTPPNTQGFAPHYDDIEAFILQLEGKKRWRVYAPRSADETLPRESSVNFGPGDKLPPPLLDVVVEAGDLLYFPRGFIHQGETVDDVHSLHITISAYQKTSYADLLEKLLPKALASAAESDVEFRRGLPLNCFGQGGVVYSHMTSTSRTELSNKLKALVDKMMASAPIDYAIDEMAKEFIHSSLPPVLTENDNACSIFGGAERWSHANKRVTNHVELMPDTLIKLIRKNCCRLTMGENENTFRLYYNLENSLEYREEEVKYLEITSQMAPGVDDLINSYPDYIKISDLALETQLDKEILAMGLWERGIVITDEPLDILEDE